MQTLHAQSVLLDQTWRSNVRIGIDDGVIRSIVANVDGASTDEQVGVVLPGIPNAHSHAFQRALVGRTEFAKDADDNFWTWRNAMYALSEKLAPENLRAIAELLYMEMLEAGYTSVAEFHYLHHQPGGAAYDPATRLTDVLIEAAANTGIRLTIIPTLYLSRTFGDLELAPPQRRFANSAAAFIRLMDEIRKSSQAETGIGLHSLRAVPPTAIETVSEYARTEIPSAPVHIHIAEQQREVDECLAFTGQGPVEWLLDHCDVDERWCLVHATHAAPEQLQAIADRGATVVLCPTTEANLGDGVFGFSDFAACGGQFALGSDSQVNVDPFEEMRLLEYGQRLTHCRRNIAATGKQAHTGAALFGACLAGGRTALGQHCGRIAAGYAADLIVVNTDDPRLMGFGEDELLDALIFAGPNSAVADVMVAGEWQVTAGRHARRAEILAAFRDVIGGLLQNS